MLHDYNIYRSDRERVNDTNKHGGSLIAVKNTFACENLTVDLPDSCVSCKIDISGQELIFSVFYNPPKSSPYRYLSEDFNKILNAFCNLVIPYRLW